ncbi:MAG: DUF3667 domain-containing protein, partial [Pseudomonadota bacterium]|nr:DUF3667 domain-containing protein [Pseudomonadota bacterium]
AGEHHGHASNCLNCGTSLIGDYCHRCGQQGHVHRTLGAFWHDLAHSVLHLDGKIWRTLPLLAWHPGELTRRYIEGERARFVSPMALFLFSVFLMFAAIGLLGVPLNSGGSSPAEERAEATRELREEMAESSAKLGKLRMKLERAQAAGRPTEDIQAQINGVHLGMRLHQQAYRVALRHANEEEARKAERGQEKAAAKDTSEFNLIAKTGWPALDKAMEKAEKNPSLVLYKLQTNAYKFSWALIPISVPFVWLLFLRRRRYRQFGAYDHTVFVTYSISFMTLGFVALILLRPLDPEEIIAGLAITFGPPIHMYRQLRGAYRLSRFSALWRTFLLLIFAWIAASLFLTLLVAVGVFG